MGKLIIDSLTVLEDRALDRNISLLVQDPLYVGGVPPDQAKKNIQVLWFLINSHMPSGPANVHSTKMT